MKLSYRLRTMTSSINILDVSAFRMKYHDKKDAFLEKDIEIKEPYDLFKKWLDIACATPEILEPNAMCLSTVNKNGFPSSRFVLLKTVTAHKGFTFFTNYRSHKAKDIEENPNVALTFYWAILRRQVRIEGIASKISLDESKKYFYERPRASQIGALASPQSAPIPNREYLDNIENDIKMKYGENAEIPIPNWGGYLVKPKLIEFWQGQTNRLHDRIQFRYTADKMLNGVELNELKLDNEQLIHNGENGWIYERLAP